MIKASLFLCVYRTVSNMEELVEEESMEGSDTCSEIQMPQNNSPILVRSTPASSTPASRRQTEPTPTQKRKRPQEDKGDPVGEAMMAYLTKKKNTEEEIFMCSLAPMLERIPPNKRGRVKIQLLEVLVRAEEECNEQHARASTSANTSTPMMPTPAITEPYLDARFYDGSDVHVTHQNGQSYYNM
jgi:hypothetical protein